MCPTYIALKTVKKKQICTVTGVDWPAGDEGIISTLNVCRKTAKKFVKTVGDGRRPKNNRADLFDCNGYGTCKHGKRSSVCVR